MALTSTFVNIKNDFPTQLHRAQGYIKGTYTAATVTSATSPSATATGGGIANGAAVVDTTIASGVMTIRLGFAPQHVRIINVTTGLQLEWFDSMASGYYINSVIAGDKTLVNTVLVTVTTNAGSAGTSGGGGTAPTAAAGVITITFSGILTDNDHMVWLAEG